MSQVVRSGERGHLSGVTRRLSHLRAHVAVHYCQLHQIISSPSDAGIPAGASVITAGGA